MTSLTLSFKQCALTPTTERDISRQWKKLNTLITRRFGDHATLAVAIEKRIGSYYPYKIALTLSMKSEEIHVDSEGITATETVERALIKLTRAIDQVEIHPHAYLHHS